MGHFTSLASMVWDLVSTGSDCSSCHCVDTAVGIDLLESNNDSEFTYLHSALPRHSFFCNSSLEKRDTFICTLQLPALGPLSAAARLVEVTRRTGHRCPKHCLHMLLDNPCPRQLTIQLGRRNISTALQIRSCTESSGDLSIVQRSV